MVACLLTQGLSSTLHVNVSHSETVVLLSVSEQPWTVLLLLSRNKRSRRRTNQTDNITHQVLSVDEIEM